MLSGGMFLGRSCLLVLWKIFTISSLNMEEICRLCLTLSSPLSLQYLSSTLTKKIESLLTIQVIDNNFLPTQVCSLCIEKIDDIQKYHLKVAANQNLLVQYLNEGVQNLNEFYLNLKNNPVKLETEKKNYNSTAVKIVNFEVELSNVCIKEEKSEELNEAVVFTNIPDENIDSIKKEILDDDDNDVHSDDDIPLSTAESVKKLDAPLKRKKEKASAKKKKENVPTKRKQSQKEKKCSFTGRGKKVSDRPIKMEIENKSDDGFVPNNQLKCLTCFAFFDTQNDLVNHYSNDHRPKHDESESIECNYSRVECPIPNSDTVEYKYKCDKCDYMNSAECFLRRHMNCHSDKRPFECKICARTFKTPREIFIHGRAHDDSRKMECVYRCGYSTAYPGALKNHEALHRLEYKHKCEECGKGFNTSTHYVDHKNKHKGTKPFVCDICGFATHMRKYLQAHRSRLHPQVSGVKRYICVHCSFPCDTMHSLTEHMKVEHDMRTDFLCDVCGKTLKSKHKLYFHRQTHAVIKPPRQRKKYECGICGKTVSQKSNLLIHVNSHNKQRNFRCKCGKRYEQKSSLLRHQTRCRRCQVNESLESTETLQKAKEES